ncbi:MAG: hypothetical protein OTI36_16155, partial [Beijerinckiaceae bacterium]|nr:hypothetical protein [Beijerinckiaceae bacterium]
EVGLSGAVRPVAHAAPRLKEAAKLGFTRAVAPAAGPAGRRGRGEDGDVDALVVGACDHVGALVAAIAAPSPSVAANPPKPLDKRRCA